MPPPPPDQPAALLLAAGASTRLGRPKQLVLYQGEPLIRRAARLALGAGASPLLTIIDKGAEDCQAALAGLRTIIIENPTSGEGMGSSLRVGMQALEAQARACTRVLLLVCDQPLLGPEHIRALLAASGSLAAAAYNGRLGVPAVFSREHFPALAAASGDQGARDLLRSATATAVRMPEAALDIDTADDLRKLDVS